MKYLYLLMLSCSIFLYSCQSPKTPEAVVKEYLTAIDQFDTEKAGKMMTESESARQMLDNMKMYETKMSPEAKAEYKHKKKNYTFGKAVTEGDKSKIIVTNKDSELTINVTFNLVKVGNEWKVDNFSANY